MKVVYCPDSGPNCSDAKDDIGNSVDLHPGDSAELQAEARGVVHVLLTPT